MNKIIFVSIISLAMSCFSLFVSTIMLYIFVNSDEVKVQIKFSDEHSDNTTKFELPD